MRTAALFAIASTLASTVHAFCGADPGTREHLVQIQNDMTAFLANHNQSANSEVNKRGPFTVGVIWNVFYDQNNPSDGNIPQGTIDQTMRVINYYFQPVRLSFAIQGVRRIAIPYNLLHSVAPNTQQEAQLKQYRQGTVQTLNLYIVGQGPSNLAGWSSFPWEFNQNPQNDGIVYDYNYLPGGRNQGFNTGSIMAHEIGHWTGLYHTFQDGCNGGDFVADTAPEASPASGCPTGRDTCAGGGPDPINNMMDYSNDACRTGFTGGQFDRLRDFMNRFRNIYLY